jgi:hypothetical protein
MWKSSRRSNRVHLPRQSKRSFFDGKYDGKVRWTIQRKPVSMRVYRPRKQLSGHDINLYIAWCCDLAFVVTVLLTLAQPPVASVPVLFNNFSTTALERDRPPQVRSSGKERGWLMYRDLLACYLRQKLLARDSGAQSAGHARCASASWRRLHRTSLSKPAWSIGQWPMGSPRKHLSAFRYACQRTLRHAQWRHGVLTGTVGL